MTRPDQTRPDQNDVLVFIKGVLKKIPGLRWLVKYVRSHKYHPFSKITFDKTPFIVHYNEPNNGLFAHILINLGGIAYADRKGLLPVVDMKNYPNGYLDDDEVGKVNSWEYFMEQPAGVSLDDALASRKYIINYTSHKFPAQKKEFFLNHDGELDYWRGICKKYIRFKPHVLEQLAAMMQKANGRKVLGVLVRGTDFVAMKLKNHPIQPTAEQAIAKVKEVLAAEDFDTVYLATEDKNILAKFQVAFGDKLIFPECEYIDYDYSKKDCLMGYSTPRNNDKYIRGLEYLVSMLFLSKCKGLVTSMTSGSVGVMCFSEGFDYLYVFDLGYYS